MPETEFTDVTRTIVRDGRVVAEIRAQQVLNFRRRARTILLDVQYTEYDAAGNAVTTGSAERATWYTERKDAELAGSIRVRSDSQEVSSSIHNTLPVCAGAQEVTHYGRPRTAT